MIPYFMVKFIGCIGKFDKDELIKKVFSLGESEVLVKKAKGEIGRLRYWWLLNYVGPVIKGKNAEIAAKGGYLFKIAEQEKRIRNTEQILKLPTTWDMENARGTRKFRNLSFLLSIALAIIFFIIGAVPCKLCEFSWKLLLIIIVICISWLLHCRLFSILERLH